MEIRKNSSSPQKKKSIVASVNVKSPIIYKKKNIYKRNILLETEEYQKSKLTEDEFNKLISLIEENDEKNCFAKEDVSQYLYERSSLILKIIELSKTRLSELKEDHLSKGLSWVIQEIEKLLVLSSDDRLFKMFDLQRMESGNVKEVLGWMREYIELKDKFLFQRLDKINEVPQDESINLKSMHFKVSHESILNIELKDFNIFNLEKELGHEQVLPSVGYFIFVSFGLYNQINFNNFENALKEITKGYKNNSYHNSIHAADVTQTLYAMIKHGNIIDCMKFNKFDISSLMISSIIHDYKHPGFTNQFLINSNDIISTLYNGKF